MTKQVTSKAHLMLNHFRKQILKGKYIIQAKKINKNGSMHVMNAL